MAISAEQREARRKMIGSSDAAAVLGLDPYRSASDVWLVKTGRAEDFEGNKATRRGARLETVLIEFAAEELGLQLQMDVMLTHPSGLLCANLDARCLDTKAIIEAKSTVNASEWGEPGTDEVPDHVILQVHQQFGLAGPDWRVAWVPVVMPGYMDLDFRLYRVDRDDKLADAVVSGGIEFMEKHVLPDVQPSDFKPSIEVLKRIRRVPDKVVPVDDELVDALIAATAAKKQAKEDFEVAQAAILAQLDDAEGATDSRGSLSYFETHRRGYTVKPCSYRVLRVKADKSANPTNQLAKAFA